MTDDISDRIAEVLRQKQVAFGRELEVAVAITAVLGLTRHTATGEGWHSQWWMTKVERTDD